MGGLPQLSVPHPSTPAIPCYNSHHRIPMVQIDTSGGRYYLTNGAFAPSQGLASTSMNDSLVIVPLTADVSTAQFWYFTPTVLADYYTLHTLQKGDSAALEVSDNVCIIEIKNKTSCGRRITDDCSPLTSTFSTTQTRPSNTGDWMTGVTVPLKLVTTSLVWVPISRSIPMRNPASLAVTPLVSTGQ